MRLCLFLLYLLLVSPQLKISDKGMIDTTKQKNNQNGGGNTMRTLIKNAWILTMNEKMQEYKDGQIVIEDDKILYVGKPKEFDSIDNIVDAKNCLVLLGYGEYTLSCFYASFSFFTG